MGSGAEPATGDELAQVLRLCRDAGVRRIRWGALEVEFADAPAAQAWASPAIAYQAAPETASPLEELQFAASGVKPRSLRDLYADAERDARENLPPEIVVGS